MKAGSIIDVVWTILLTLLLCFIIARQIQFWNRRSKSRSWPSVFATVERSEIQFKELDYFSYYCLLEYHYTVAGEPYLGRFALLGSRKGNKDGWRDLGAKGAEDLANEWIGKQVSVRYDPLDPKVSLVADTEIAGREVHQDPEWIGSRS